MCVQRMPSHRGRVALITKEQSVARSEAALCSPGARLSDFGRCGNRLDGDLVKHSGEVVVKRKHPLHFCQHEYSQYLAP